MKVTLPQGYKKWMTVDEYTASKSIIAEFKEMSKEDFYSDVLAAARIASGDCGAGFEVLKAEAQIGANRRIDNYWAAPCDSGRLDVYVEAYVFSYYAGFFNIGFYISDIWSRTGDNDAEIKEHMFIRAYRKSDH